MLGELALAEEALGDTAAADVRFQESIAALAVEYPETNALASVRARYAAFLTRQGQADKAPGTYREVVNTLPGAQRSISGLARSAEHTAALQSLNRQSYPAFFIHT